MTSIGLASPFRRRASLGVFAALVCGVAVLFADARPAQALDGAGLGLAGGFQSAFPARGRGLNVTEAWGLYVDLPLVSFFTLSPQTTVYRLERPGLRGVGVTDLVMNFKFVIDTKYLDIDLFPRMGVSVLSLKGTTVMPYAGLGAGFRAWIVSTEGGGGFGLGLHAGYGLSIDVTDKAETGTLQQVWCQASLVFRFPR